MSSGILKRKMETEEERREHMEQREKGKNGGSGRGGSMSVPQERQGYQAWACSAELAV